MSRVDRRASLLNALVAAYNGNEDVREVYARSSEEEIAAAVARAQAGGRSAGRLVDDWSTARFEIVKEDPRR